MLGFLAMAAAAAAVGPDSRCAARVGPYQPPHGIIGTPRVAARVAEIYLVSIYGAELVQRELPLRVLIRREVWHITGRNLGPDFVGGVAEIDICQSTGQVLRVTHGK